MGLLGDPLNNEIKEIQEQDWAQSQSNDAFLHAEAEKEAEPKE